MLYTIPKPSEIGMCFQPGISGWKSISSLRKITGADVMVNAQMWEMKTGITNYALKINKQVYGTDEGAWIFGYGWNIGETTLHWSTADHMKEFDNYIGCEKLVNDYKVDIWESAQKAYAGTRGRTGLGVKEDNTIVIFCTNDYSPLTIVDLANTLITAGCKTAIMLDGGASSQLDSDKGQVHGKRYVQSLFYAKNETLEARVTKLEKAVFQK